MDYRRGNAVKGQPIWRSMPKEERECAKEVLEVFRVEGSALRLNGDASCWSRDRKQGQPTHIKLNQSTDA
jgi:hypothetical protein